MHCGGRRLEDTGFGVGLRLLEILSFREKGSKRDIRLLDVLKFVHTSLWKYLFGHHARDLEQSNTVSLAAAPCIREDMLHALDELRCHTESARPGVCAYDVNCWQHQGPCLDVWIRSHTACRLRMST